jgi:integrase
LGAWAVSDITTETIKQYQDLRRPQGHVGMNRDLSVLRAIFNWAIGEGLIEKTPFKRGGISLIKKAKEAKRSRRLEPGEGERLLNACGAPLRAIVEAALETGCRRGELLSLQWGQVRLDGPRPAIVLTAAKTKTQTQREVPISVRLRAILEMRRRDAAGEKHKASAFVFGHQDTGEAVKSFKRSWATATLRAHGRTPEYIKGSALLTPACLEWLRAIDLHFHDLRREAGSRWLDAGVPLHTIQRWLGHANISQTSTYLAVTDTGSHEAMARFDVGRNLAPAPASHESIHQLSSDATKH